MSRNGSAGSESSQAQDLKSLREARKEIVGRVRARVKEQNRIQRELLQALKNGPKTVPEIAGETGLSPQTVFWFLMGLKKYGRVIESEQWDSYPAYALKEE
jgi:predicted transcriptional regulator